MTIARHCYRFLGGVVESSSLEVFKTQTDKVLSILVWIQRCLYFEHETGLEKGQGPLKPQCFEGLWFHVFSLFWNVSVFGIHFVLQQDRNENVIPERRIDQELGTILSPGSLVTNTILGLGICYAWAETWTGVTGGSEILVKICKHTGLVFQNHTVKNV